MNKVILALVLTLSTLLVPSTSLAQTNLEPGVCVTVYGGGVVCGAQHEVVPTGLADNPALLGAVLMGASGTLFFLSKKMKKTSQISG